MPNNKKKLPKDIIEHWPEIFSDIELKVVPIKYLHSVRVEFIGGKQWVIDIAKSKVTESLESIENSLLELLNQYQDQILHIDFRLDTAKLKTDIQNRTRHFLKKRQ